MTHVIAVLQEPCRSSGCDLDQHIFKGVFMRHLSHMLAIDSSFARKGSAYILENAYSMLENAACFDGGFGVRYAAFDIKLWPH
jgi:hypothetical protein